MNRYLRLFFTLGFICLIVNPVTFGKPSDADVSHESAVVEEQVVWLRDGEEDHFSIPVIHGKEYWSIDNLAALSQAQVHWEQTDGRACLSHTQGEMCFSWKDARVKSSKNTSGKKVALLYQDSKLWIPVSFVTSSDFEAFCKSEFKWDSYKKTLFQNSPVTLVIPAVENFGDRYRLTLRVSPTMGYSLLQKDEKRIWLQFLRARTSGSQILEGDSVIRDIHIQQHRNSADLLVNLGVQAVSSNVQLDSDKTHLLIDVFMVKPPVTKIATPEKKPNPVIRPVPEAKLDVPKNPNYPSPVVDKKIRTIIVDAGHGGMDCGAIGVKGTMEKDINLRVAKSLAERLEKEPNTRVILTRTKDEFIPLKQRTEMANAAKADIFISIHCNSSLTSKSKGFEAYVLSPDATDEAAATVARVENSVVQIESKEHAKSTKANELLASMAIANFINESTKMANLICRGVKQKASVHSAVIREANFFVLRGAMMPGVLVELDYLSNSVMESRLRSTRYTSQLVKGISDGVLFYDRSARVKLAATIKEAHKIEEQGK